MVASATGSGLVGSYRTVAQRLDAYAEAGFELALLHFYPMIDGMRDFMANVVPLMKSRAPAAS